MLFALAQTQSGLRADAELVALLLWTVAFLALAVVVLQFIRAFETKLILLGLICAVTATGFGATVPSSLPLAAMLMKIGVILVLGGVACGLVTYLNGAGRRDEPGESHRHAL